MTSYTLSVDKCGERVKKLANWTQSPKWSCRQVTKVVPVLGTVELHDLRGWRGRFVAGFGDVSLMGIRISFATPVLKFWDSLKADVPLNLVETEPNEWGSWEKRWEVKEEESGEKMLLMVLKEEKDDLTNFARFLHELELYLDSLPDFKGDTDQDLIAWQPAKFQGKKSSIIP